MRAEDTEKHPAAVARGKRDRLRVIAGLVIAAAGIVAAFKFPEHLMFGFTVALIGAGIVPVEKIPEMIRRP